MSLVISFASVTFFWHYFGRWSAHITSLLLEVFFVFFSASVGSRKEEELLITARHGWEFSLSTSTILYHLAGRDMNISYCSLMGYWRVESHYCWAMVKVLFWWHPNREKGKIVITAGSGVDVLVLPIVFTDTCVKRGLLPAKAVENPAVPSLLTLKCVWAHTQLEIGLEI